jgi:hypothetical protein
VAKVAAVAASATENYFGYAARCACYLIPRLPARRRLASLTFRNRAGRKARVSFGAIAVRGRFLALFEGRPEFHRAKGLDIP